MWTLSLLDVAEQICLSGSHAEKKNVSIVLLFKKKKKKQEFVFIARAFHFMFLSEINALIRTILESHKAEVKEEFPL